jgi:hypothetical protein
MENYRDSDGDGSAFLLSGSGSVDYQQQLR